MGTHQAVTAGVGGGSGEQGEQQWRRERESGGAAMASSRAGVRTRFPMMYLNHS